MIHSLEDVSATTSTNVALSSTSIQANWVQIQSPTGNTASRIGDGSISATRGATIAGGNSQFFPAAGVTNPYDLSQIYIRGTTGEKFNVIYNVA